MWAAALRGSLLVGEMSAGFDRPPDAGVDRRKHVRRADADEVWAKLLWAGLNLDPADLPQTRSGHFYPFELVHAVTLTWLFSGQYSNEIARLRLGCVSWQHDGAPIAGDSQQVLARAEVHRPPTGEQVELLFAVRARRLSISYINNTVIPMLCRKAEVPDSDVRGNITSHRPRSSIASQLYNAKEPMTLFELHAWLGRRTPQSTQYYGKITPNTVSKAYSAAGYFERNVRTIEVLVDRDAVASGTAAAGEPWQHYGLGHGYCTYSFFEQCQHRMAYARCDLYAPKDSTRAQLLEAKGNLQRRTAATPLTDEEHAAVDDGQAALVRPLERLTDTPTPRELDVPTTARLLPLIAVRQGSAGQRRADIGVRSGSGECHSHSRDLDGRTRQLLPHWPARAPELRNAPG